MQTDPTMTANTPRPPDRPTARAAAGAPAISSDFETFLNMLATQLRNQDPLNPVDSADYAVQLATFSSVEQQVLTNDLLKQMAGAGGTGGLDRYAGWVGMEARSSAPVRWNGTPVDLSPKPEVGATTASLVILDAAGDVVGRHPLPVAPGPYTWDGTDGAGASLPTGLYRFEVESRTGGEILARQPVPAYGRITELRLAEGAPLLVMSGGAEIVPDEVSALRRPA